MKISEFYIGRNKNFFVKFLAFVTQLSAGYSLGTLEFFFTVKSENRKFPFKYFRANNMFEVEVGKTIVVKIHC